MNKLRWGIIGCGTISVRFIDCVKYATKGMVQVIYSRDIDRARAVAEKYGIPSYYNDLDKLIASKEIDVAYIAANHPYHENLAIKFLEAGIPVICEKPLAVNAGQVERMIAAAKKNDVLLMEAIWTRFFPIYAQVREWMDEGKIGKLLSIDAQLGFKFKPHEYPRIFDRNEAGSTLLDLGVYELNAMKFINPGSEIITLNSCCLIGETGTENTNAAVLRFANGVIGTMTMSFDVDLSEDLTIRGEKGKITVPLFTQPKSVRLETEDTRIERSYDFPGEGFQFEIDAFSEMVMSGVKDSAVMPVEESLEIAKYMDAMRKEWGITFPCE